MGRPRLWQIVAAFVGHHTVLVGVGCAAVLHLDRVDHSRRRRNPQGQIGKMVDLGIQFDRLQGFHIQRVGQDDLEGVHGMVVVHRKKRVLQQKKGWKLLKKLGIGSEREEVLLRPKRKLELAGDRPIQVFFCNGAQPHQDLEKMTALTRLDLQGHLPVLLSDQPIRDQELCELLRFTHAGGVSIA